MVWNVKMIEGGAVVSTEGLSAAATPSQPGELVLDENHPMWDHHSGGDRHTG